MVADGAPAKVGAPDCQTSGLVSTESESEMTRKDYEKFATMLAGELALARCTDGDRGHRIRGVILSTADIFAQDNARFDRDRFYQACGL